MALLAASVPLPLLPYSLLASSWTWLALSLATIATLLRGLSRIPFSRHRPESLLPPPPSILSAETEQLSSLICEVPQILRLAHKRRGKSTSALENLLQKPDAKLACRELGFLFCIRGHHAAAPLLFSEAGSSSKSLNGRPSCGSGDFSESELRLWPHTFDCKLGSRSRLGFHVDNQKGGIEAPAHGFIREDINPHHLWTSDLVSKCKPRQNSLSDLFHSPSHIPLSFERQFSWDKLLAARLGAPWRNHSGRLVWASLQVLEPTVPDGSVVKVWSTQQRNLLKALIVEESSVVTLDVNMGVGLACTAYTNGEISRWDISNQACLSRVCCNVQSVSALCLNAEKGVAITGIGEFLGLWDHKSPSLIPLSISDGSVRSVSVSPYSALRCEGDVVLIDGANGVFSSCDLRKPQGSCLPVAANPISPNALSKMEEEESLFLWEMLACDDEEEVWDEDNFGHGNVLQKSSSFASRCATIVRSLSTSGR